MIYFARSRAVALASLVVTAATIFSAVPAFATDESNDVVDFAAELVSDHYGDPSAEPEILDETQVQLLPPTGASGQAFTVTPPASEVEVDDSGKEVIAFGTDGNSATLIEKTANAVKLTTAVMEPSAAQNFEYTISGVTDPYLVPVGDGSYKVLDSQNRYVVDLGAPWAVDASGDYLATHYELKSGTLTQVVDYEDAVFPVVADPAWSYSVDHASFQLITGREKASASRVMAELRRCFNCSFPVSGAPSAFPWKGQVLPLKVGYGRATYPAPVRVTTISTNGFSFVSEPGHFDGAGSSINFYFYNDRSGWLHLSVNARVLTDNNWIGNQINRQLASETWSTFHGNLLRRRTL